MPIREAKAWYENGFARIEHLGAVHDVSRYLEAELKAVADAGPAKEVGHDTSRK
jgi:hypothetical protein